MKTETTEVLAAVDDQLDDDEDGAPMIDPDTGIVIDDHKVPEEPLTNQEMIEFLYSCPQVFLEEIPSDDEDGFELDLDSKTEEISKLLEDHPTTLHATFVALTDQVEYKEFWKRYYYRLGDMEKDESKLGEIYEYYRSEQETFAKTVKSSKKALASVTNFLGGAVKRLVDEGEERGSGDVASNQFFSTAETSAASAMNFFGGNRDGRPPFVLNTAVSEDDDDTPEAYSDDEEELGWDDDDDDDDFDDEDDQDENLDEEGNQGMIEFKDVAKEKLEDDLEQTIEERDQLHSTIAMQRAEIQKLKELATAKDDSKEVKGLKMKVFEKDAELAALRASLADSRVEGGVASPAKNKPSNDEEIEQLRAKLSQKDSQIAKLEEELKAADEKSKTLERANADSESNKVALEQANEKNKILEAELQSLQQAMSQLKVENDNLRQQQESKSGDTQAAMAQAKKQEAQSRAQIEELSSKTIALQSELESAKTATSAIQAKKALLKNLAQQQEARSKARIQELTTKTGALQSELEAAKTATATLDVELKECKEALERAQEELEATSIFEIKWRDAQEALERAQKELAARPSSPDSSSTGVQVASPNNEVEAPKSATKLEEPVAAVVKLSTDVGDDDDDDDDDGWGDDW